MLKYKNCTLIATVLHSTIRRSALYIVAALVVASFAAPAVAEVSFESDSGWKFGVNGHIPVYALLSNNDDLEEDAFRITTGFNPATLQFNVYAPTQNGLEVSGHFQLNSHLAGADGVQNSGYDLVDFGRQSGSESRVAEIAVSANWGILNIGKGLGIYGTPAIGDAGSGKGVGLFSPNEGDSTAGRIGNGYFYTNFNPRVIYTSPSIAGLQFKVGVFQPEKPKDGDPTVDASVGTESPRVEANVVWSGGLWTLWSSGFAQSVEVENSAVDDFTMRGFDVGGAFALGSFNLRANYGLTQGTGNFVFGGHGVTGGAEEEDAEQWYVEGTYDVTNRTTLGVSYGEGTDDLSDNNTDLSMLFARHKATDAWTLMAEVQDFSTDVPNGDYSAVIVGAQLTF